MPADESLATEAAAAKKRALDMSDLTDDEWIQLFVIVGTDAKNTVDRRAQAKKG
jgi:hypothetical protein